MLLRIVIYHLSGPKIKQVEQFACEAFGELTIGTKQGCAIQFDGADALGIGREHASIKITSDDPPRFVLRDLGSRSGTFLNGRPVGSGAEISAGDEVELGRGGPRFAVDVQSPRTRVVSLADAESEPVASRTADPAAPQLPALLPGLPARATIAEADPEPAAPPLPSRQAAWAAAVAAVLIAAAMTLYPLLHGPASALPPGIQASNSLPASAQPDAAAAAAAPAPTNLVPAEPALPPQDVPAPAAVAAAARSPAPAAAPPSALAAPAAADEITDTPKPDLAGTVRKIAGASRFMIGDQWIELFGIDDPSSGGEHNRAVYEYLKPFAGVMQCYEQPDGRFKCFAGRQDLALIAIREHLVRLTAEAPPEYRALAAAGR